MVWGKFNKNYSQVADGRGTRSGLPHEAPSNACEVGAHDEAGSELRRSRILASSNRLHPTLLSLANPHRGLSGAGLPY